MENDEYQRVVGGRLKLKTLPGRSSRKRKRATRLQITKTDIIRHNVEAEQDTIDHCGWWIIKKPQQLSGPVVFQLPGDCYLSALDTGNLVAEPYTNGEPAPHQIFNAVRLDGLLSAVISMGGTALTPVPEDKFAFKTGFGRYVSAVISGDGRPHVSAAEAEAIGPLEQWVVSEVTSGMFVIKQAFLHKEHRAALAGGNPIIVRSKEKNEQNEPSSDLHVCQDDLKQVEENCVRMYQKFQDKKLKLNPRCVSELKVAKKQGLLHEKMLDRREKMKSDRYCK
ncbi:hypothetical protein ACOME3_007111 [Neoechinorhynchus agilis]